MAAVTPILPVPELGADCARGVGALEGFLAGSPPVDKMLGETMRLCGMTLRAAGAGLFMTPRPDQPEMAIEHHFTELHMVEAGRPLAGLLVAVRRCAREIKPLIVPPFFIDNEAGDLPVNPSACELLFVPMKLHGKAQMVLVTAVAPTGDAQTHRIAINFLQRMLGLLEAALTARQLSLMERDRGANTKLTKFAEAVHKHLLLTEVAADIANLSRDSLGAARVTVELYPPRGKKVLAVSNVDEANKRAALFAAQKLILEYVRDRNVAVALDRAAAKQLVSDAMLQDAATAYFLVTEFAAFAAAPIAAEANAEAMGVVLAEYDVADSRQDAGVTCGGVALGDLARISAGSVGNAMKYEAIPLRRTLGACADLLRKPFTTRRACWAGMAAAALIVVALLALVPVDFAIKADCNMQPVSQLGIVAPLPGQIIEVPVRAGEHVYPRGAAGARPLMVFDTTDLLAEKSGQQQKEAELNVQLKDLQEKGDISKIGGVQLQLKQVADQLKLLDHRIEQSTVYSPIEGTVLTENIEQKKWSTVSPGEALVDVASFKDWVLVVDVPESEVATVRTALAQRPGGVEIEYILNPWPDRRFEVHARGVATLLPASAQAKNANVFRLQVSINPADLPEGIAMSGVTGRAKVHVGSQPLLGQWTRGLGRVLRMTALF